jgi:hypothetical protein
METTETIVGLCARCLKNWITIPTIKCMEQREIESERRKATEGRP